MRRVRITPLAAWIVVGVTCLLAISGCQQSLFTQFEQWDHVIVAAEFTPHPTLDCLVYTCEDARFNNVDFFETYMITVDGLSDFDSTYDAGLGVFLYQPVYSTGTVTWLAHTGADSVLTGETLRYFHIWK